MKNFVLYVCVVFSCIFDLAATGCKMTCHIFPNEKLYKERLLNIQQTFAKEGEEKTFDNTFRPWNQLTAEFYRAQSQYKYELDGNFIGETRVEAFQKVIDDFSDYLFKNPELYHLLLQYYSQNFTGLSAQELYSLQSFLDACKQAELYPEDTLLLTKLEGKHPLFNDACPNVAKNVTFNEELTFLNVNAFYFFTCLINDDLTVLIDDIGNKRADVICFEGVFTNENALLCYERLKEKYGYFYRSESLSFSSLPNGLLIASKYPIKDTEILQLGNGNEAIAFTLENQQSKLVHVCALDLQFFNNFQLAWERERILDNLLSRIAINDGLPIICCGNMDLPSIKPFKGNFKLSTGHGEDNVFCLLLTQISSEYNLENKYFIYASYPNLMSSIKETQQVVSESFVPQKINKVVQWEANSNNITLCDCDCDGEVHGSVGVSGGVDSNGDSNVSVNGGFDYNTPTDNGGNVDVYVNGQGSVDNNGNVSGEVSGGVTWNF